MKYRFRDTDAVPVRVPITHQCHTCRYFQPDPADHRVGRCSITGQYTSSQKGTKCYDHCGKDVTRIRWTVYDNATDEVLITCGTITEAATRLGLTVGGFRKKVWEFRKCRTEAERSAQRYYFVREVTNW